jgi:hypothetical protein
MCPSLGICGRLVQVVFLAGTLAVPLSATTYPGSVNFGSNLGHLSYTASVVTGARCIENNGRYFNYIYYSFYNFAFVSSQGITQPISGSTGYISGGAPQQGCPHYPPGPPLTFNGNGYTIVISPYGSATITVPGYINPKYVVLGIVYAPPGGKSNVSYSTSNLVSSTLTTKNTFTSGYTQSNTVETSLNIMPWKNGAIDSSAKSSTSYTNTTTATDSTAVTAQQVTGISSTFPGPTCDYCGVDHDYDQIGVWLNPVLLYTLTNNGVVQANGYGYSSWDQPGTDVYWVYVGELNGDFQMRGSTTQAFARSWASALTWPSGQRPALTAQDMQSILKMDPYWNCTYKSPVTDTTDCAEPPDSHRYTQSTNSNFPYAQPIPGIGPDSKTYTWSYTNTNDVTNATTLENDQTVSYESTFGVSIFGFGFKDTIGQSTTIKSIYETSSEFKSSNTSTASASITGPVCNVVGGFCTPTYPPPNAYDPTKVPCTPLQLLTAFGQGTNMYIYQDNLFGSFMLEPYGQ